MEEGEKGGIQPLRIGILGTQDTQLSSAQEWPGSGWQGPLRGRKVAPDCAKALSGTSLAHCFPLWALHTGWKEGRDPNPTPGKQGSSQFFLQMEANIYGEGWAQSQPLRRSHHAFLSRIWVLGGLRSLCSRKALSKTFSDINRTNVFLGQSPKAIEIKINKWELVKLTRFCTAKETTHTQKERKDNLRNGRKYLRMM